MGNQSSGLPTKSKCSSPCKKAQKQSKDEFIIELNRKFHQNVSTIEMDPRRVVFVSLIGLFQTYHSCPPHVLYSSLFVLPLKKQWLYDCNIFDADVHHHDESTNPFYTFSLFNSVEETESFLQLLQYKDAQGLLLCALDEQPDDNNTSSLIQPFWRRLSNKLCTLYDTVTGSKYNALLLNDEWWETQYSTRKYPAKYGTTTSQVLNELYFMPMNYKAVQEIIYQSNPNLNVITFYGQKAEFYKPTKDVLLSDFAEDLCDDDDEEQLGEWYISVDYEM